MALGRQRPGAEVPVVQLLGCLSGNLLQGKVTRWAGTLQGPRGFMKKGAKDRGRVEDREDPCAFFPGHRSRLLRAVGIAVVWIRREGREAQREKLVGGHGGTS